MSDGDRRRWPSARREIGRRPGPGGRGATTCRPCGTDPDPPIPPRLPPAPIDRGQPDPTNPRRRERVPQDPPLAQLTENTMSPVHEMPAKPAVVANRP